MLGWQHGRHRTASPGSRVMVPTDDGAPTLRLSIDTQSHPQSTPSPPLISTPRLSPSPPPRSSSALPHTSLLSKKGKYPSDHVLATLVLLGIGIVIWSTSYILHVYKSSWSAEFNGPYWRNNQV